MNPVVLSVCHKDPIYIVRMYAFRSIKLMDTTPLFTVLLKHWTPGQGYSKYLNSI